MLSCGIVGLPLCGKSTVFNVITRAGAEVKPYAGGRTDPNRAVVSVPDARFDRLVSIYAPRKETPASVEFVDLAGLSQGASRGAGLGNAFLSFVENADALVHVVRAFANGEVPHPLDGIDPLRDWQAVEMELIFRDLAVIENRMGRLAAKKKLQPAEEQERLLLEKCQAHLMEERPLRDLELAADEKTLLRGFAFVTLKPELVVVNADDSQTGEGVPGLADLERLGRERGFEVIKVYGAMEMEMAELSPEDQTAFMADLAIDEPGRERLIAAAYRLLGLISFFTVGPDEVRAWTLRDGGTAVDAAGTIHSDLARGFIRAEIVSYDDFAAQDGSKAKLREKGLLRLEGKECPVRDGDIIEIRFNV